MQNKLRSFLADTWWYGLTQRISSLQFDSLALLRAQQGFTAVQIVVGIPPEVGPSNPNAISHVGAPWSLDGGINFQYLSYARKKVESLNKLGLMGIVYGAWGHQIDWIGPRKMSEWWLRIIEYLDDLDIIYCLSGEINLWVGRSFMLLPSKTTDDILQSKFTRFATSKTLKGIIGKLGNKVLGYAFKTNLNKRRNDWDYVLGVISQATNKPILVHPTANETGFEAILRPHLLAANTAQTGHDESSRERLWQLPLVLTKNYPKELFINLEPWYEGIKDQFKVEDQLFSYWASMLGGTASYCYGAHGIWNIGDGSFLSHWGKQTFSEALSLETPALIGRSHKELMKRIGNSFETDKFYEAKEGELITMGQKNDEKIIVQYFPDISKAQKIPDGMIWLPLQGIFTSSLPSQGQVVIFSN